MFLIYLFKTAGYEQKKWEEEHLAQATLKFGAKDAKSRKQEKEYEYILDDEIEFVQALQMPGTKVVLGVSENKGKLFFFLKKVCYTRLIC